MCCPAPLACPPPPTCRACRRRAVLGVRTSEMPRHAPPRHGEAGAPPTCAATRRRDLLPLCFLCVCVVCPASHPHPTSILCTRHAESPCLEPANSGGCLWCVTVYCTAPAWPPPSTHARHARVSGVRPRAVPRVSPPSPFHVPPACPCLEPAKQRGGCLWCVTSYSTCFWPAS